MIYDEILTGFRIGLGGAAEYYGVRPDLWTFSKALGGGFPVSVYGGKAKIMECVVDCSTLAPGTFNGHHVAMAAIINVIEQLRENDGEIFKRIGRLHEMLKEGFLANSKKHGVEMIVQGFPGALVPVFTAKECIINNEDALEHASVALSFLFSGLMKREGILNNIRFCIGAGHTEGDIKKAIEASDAAFARNSTWFFTPYLCPCVRKNFLPAISTKTSVGKCENTSQLPLTATIFPQTAFGNISKAGNPSPKKKTASAFSKTGTSFIRLRTFS